MIELYILYSGNQHSNLGISLRDPIVRDGYYLGRNGEALINHHGSHSHIKVGDIVSIIGTDDGLIKKKQEAKITSIRTVDSFKEIKQSSSYENWIKFINIQEHREKQIEKIVG